MEFNTDKGKLNENQLMSVLMWGSYKANRDDGVSHERLVEWKIGNEAFRQRYELEKKGIYEN